MKSRSMFYRAIGVILILANFLCLLCGCVTPPHIEPQECDHSYSWVIDIDPTYTAPGIKHKECSACGDKINENTAVDRLIHEEKIDEAIDPSLFTCENFKNVSQIYNFYSQNQEKIGGKFIYFDTSLIDKKIHVIAQEGFSPYFSFDYREEKNGLFVDSRMISYFSFYSEELGTDTDINKDVMYHSMTFYMISTVYEHPIDNMEFEFYSSTEKGKKWDYMIEVYNGELCIAKIFYNTGLDVSPEWIVELLYDCVLEIK